MDFKSGTLDTSYVSRKMDFHETNGEICDKNGKLLFYSNGVWVGNTNNDTMLNGSGLNPSLLTSMYQDGLILPQGNLIIPFSNDTSKYYLFHLTLDNYPYMHGALFLYYSIIDMSLDSGRGAVTQKNVILKNDSLIGGLLTACKHANGRDWWLIAHQYNSNLYYKFLITPYGIEGPLTQNIGTVRTDFLLGQDCFSPDGKKFAWYEPVYKSIYYSGISYLDIYDFNRCTGDFSNPITVPINDSAFLGGLAFSPNSQVLYASSESYIYQFDLTAPDIAASQTTVAVWDSSFSPSYPLATTFYLSQLAPDGKIYINCGNGTLDIHVINNPDIVGLGCNVCQHCIRLPAYNAFTIANHPNYFLGADSGSVCDTLTKVQSLSTQSSKLEIYPNPVVAEEVTFTYNVSSELGTINIYNIEGKEVAKYNLPQWSSVQHLKLPKLSAGVYLARLTQGKVVADTKFLKE